MPIHRLDAGDPYAPFRFKPQADHSGKLGINWNHPLSHGLVWCVTPGGGHIEDMVTGNKGTFMAGGHGEGTTALGSAMVSTSTTNGGMYWPLSPKIQSITNQYTVVVWLAPTTYVAYSTVVCVPYATTWQAPWGSFLFSRNSSGTAGRLNWIQGTTEVATTSATNFIGGTDPLTFWGASRNATIIKFWRNGAQHGTNVTSSTAANINWNSLQPICLLNRSSTSNGEAIAGRTPFAALWSRELTLAEHQWLYREPYAMLARIRPKRFGIVTASAAEPIMQPMGIIGPVG